MRQQVAVYMRVSLEDVDKRSNCLKDESNSITSQRLLINRHLDQLPALCDLPRVEFFDDGFSGTNFDRPGFAQMIDYAKRGEISCIVVKDLSRFGRDYLEVGDYLEHIFPFFGIRFKSVNDGYDSLGHQGKTIGMDVAFRNLIYDYYSKDLSQKVKSGMGVRQKRAQYVSCVPYGYRVAPNQKHQLLVDEATAPVVRRIFMDMIAGKPCTAIAKELNAEGIPTPLQQKNISRRHIVKQTHWTRSHVWNILGNIKYTGTMVNHTRESRSIRDKNQRRVPKEEWYIRENAHEAIVTQEEYDQAQASIRKRKSSSRNPQDRLDRVYYCAHCGGKLEKANGTVFACPSHRYHDESPCKEVYWKKAALEEVLLEALKKQIEISCVKASKKKKTSGTNPLGHLSRLKMQYENCGREKLSKYEAYREGKLTADQYLAEKEAIAKKQEELQMQIAQCEVQIEAERENLAQEQARLSSVSHMADLSEEMLKVHLYDAVERIVVHDRQSIEIVWKFDEIKS